MKKIFILIFFLSSLILKSQIIQNDSVLNINCSHDGAIFTQISSLDTNVFSKWFYFDTSWVQIDTSHQFIYLNKNKYNSDTLLTVLCGEYKLEIVNILDTLLEQKLISIGCSLTADLVKDPIKCYNELGSIESFVSGGIPFDPDSNVFGDEFYQYQWFVANNNSGLNTTLLSDTVSLIDSLPAAFYKLVIADAAGCQDTSSFIELMNPNKLEFNFLNLNHANCFNTSSASLFFSISGGRKFTDTVNYFYYLISNSDTISFSDTSGLSSNFQSYNITSSLNSLSPDSILINNLVSGVYQLFIIDSSGCVIDTTFSLNEPDAYELFASHDPLICSSDSVWIKIDSISGGIPPFNFYWELTFLDSIFGNNAQYHCIIYDTVNNCNDTIEYNISSLYEINTTIKKTNIKCFSDSTGSIYLDSIYGGTSPYNISWGTDSLFSLPANGYGLLIIDAIGCKYIDTIVINQPEQLQSNPVIIHPICYSDSNGFVIQNYLGGTPPYQVIGFNTNTIDTIKNLSAGYYPYLVLDSNLCELYDTLIITEPAQISSQFINYTPYLDCYNGSTLIEVVVSDYDSSYNLLWSNGSTNSITSILAGMSIVDIVDNNGCRYSDTIFITQPDTFKIEELILIDTICNSGGSAFVTLSGGTLPYSYLWSTGETDSFIVNIPDSTFWVNVFDSCGNVLFSDSLFFIPFNLETSLFFDDSSHIAEIEIDVSTTGGPFLYEWKDVLGQIISLSSYTDNLCEGIYYVSVTDESNGCLVEDTLNATFYLPLGIVDSMSTTVLPDSSLWGFSPYKYLWDNGSNLAHADLCSGDHWVEVTDNIGCMVREIVIIDPLLISISPQSVLIECDLENLDIDLEASATGGIGPYVFEWWNGSNDNPLNLGMNPGNFNITVIDNNGCISDTSFVIATLTEECIPNVFSPNNDGVNDTWSLEDTFIYEDSEIRIYGRFGSLVFQSVGYHERWDGTNENGKDLPAGVYFYSIEIGHGFERINGTVTILR